MLVCLFDWLNVKVNLFRHWCCLESSVMCSGTVLHNVTQPFAKTVIYPPISFKTKGCKKLYKTGRGVPWTLARFLWKVFFRPWPSSMMKCFPVTVFLETSLDWRETVLCHYRVFPKSITFLALMFKSDSSFRIQIWLQQLAHEIDQSGSRSTATLKMAHVTEFNVLLFYIN